MPELKIFIDDMTMENLKEISDRSGLSMEEIVREIIVRNVAIIRTIVEKSDIKALCGDVGIDVSDTKNVRMVIEAGQVLAAIKREMGEIPYEVKMDEIKLKSVKSKDTKMKRIKYLAQLGVARLEDGKLVFDYPELAYKFLDCAKMLERLHGKKLISWEERPNDKDLRQYEG